MVAKRKSCKKTTTRKSKGKWRATYMDKKCGYRTTKKTKICPSCGNTAMWVLDSIK